MCWKPIRNGMLVVLLIPFLCEGQSTPGKAWQGIAAGKKDTLDISLQLNSVITDTVRGTITYFFDQRKHFQTYSVRGRFINKDSLVLRDDDLVDKNMPAFCCHCYGVYRLKYEGDKLHGTWTQFSKPLLMAGCEKRDIILNAAQAFVQVSTVEKISKRKDSIVQRLVFNHLDTIEIYISDYGVVDDDIVSIIFNDSVIADHYKLNSSPVFFSVVQDNRSKRNYLKIYAENLGKIPPNTAYVVIKGRAKEYRFEIPSDYTTNGVVEIDLQ